MRQINTGGSIFAIAPQVSYNLGKTYISLIFDYPFYRNLTGEQLSIGYSIALNISYQFKPATNTPVQ